MHMCITPIRLQDAAQHKSNITFHKETQTRKSELHCVRTAVSEIQCEYEMSNLFCTVVLIRNFYHYTHSDNNRYSLTTHTQMPLTHSLLPTLLQPHSLTHSLTHTHTQIHYKQSRTVPFLFTHTNKLTHSHSQTQTLTHTHSRAHTHTNNIHSLLLTHASNAHTQREYTLTNMSNPLASHT